MEEYGQGRKFDTGTSSSGGNHIAMNGFFVFLGQHVQKELFDFGGFDQFTFDFVYYINK